MVVQFSLSQSDHYCLLTHAENNSAIYEALFNGREIPLNGGQAESTRWEIRCNAADAIAILKLAHEVCPQAAADIRKGIDLSAS